MNTFPAGPLDLSDANFEGFEALEAGRYNAEVFEIKMDASKNPGGKMPVGTPIMKVQFKLTDEGVENRRVFTQYVIPPADYDKQKAATMKGMIGRFFIALGDEESTVKSASFSPDFEDYIGRPCVVVLSKEPKYGTQPEDNEWQNNVKGVKPVGADTGTGGGLL